MTLSKQLYLIISFIFFMIFVGNFIISINNFKDYLEIESKTKSQDTATSLGMSLKSLIDDKTDSEIESTIKAIANRGFYKEIRLEDVQFDFTSEDLLKKVNLDNSYKIKNISVSKSDGEIVNSNDDNILEMELQELEGEKNINSTSKSITYSFIPSLNFPNNKNLEINFIAFSEAGELKSKAKIQIDKVLVKVTRDEKFETVPQWFIDLVPMKMVETNSEISNGWKTQAIIYVSANAGEAYSKLYNQAINAVIYAIIAFIISFSILIIFLRFILKPLKNIEILAKDISLGHFKTIDNLPWTLELKNVSLSMNDMSHKIKSMISKLNSNLEKMTEQLSKDDLTGLQQEQTFQTDMKQMFIKKEDGYILSVKIDDLSSFAKNNPHNIVEKFLKEFSYALNNCDDEDLNAYRFFGSTFAIISKKTEQKEIELITRNLKRSFDNLCEKYNIINIAHIGVTPFNPISTTNDILKLANEAYEMAKQIGHNEAYIRDKNDLARDMIEWKDLIFNIINNSMFTVDYINKAISLDSKNNLLMEEAFTSAKDKDNETIQIGTFISIAEKYEKIIDFDKAVINEVIKYINSNNITHDILINLAFDSLMNNNFKQWLAELLKEHNSIASQLVFSVTAYGCVKDIEAFKQFISLVHKNGAKIILKRFETKFIPLDNLNDLNLDYIRLARDYTNGIANDVSKQNFVESVCELSKLLNIKVFAESVKDEENIIELEKLGVYGASK